jgi:hypothetical protein
MTVLEISLITSSYKRYVCVFFLEAYIKSETKLLLCVVMLCLCCDRFTLLDGEYSLQ